MTLCECWGRYPPIRQAAVDLEPGDPPAELERHASVLAFGRGHSYGDCCLNPGGALLRTARLRRVLDLDPDAGTIVCEAGTLLSQVIDRALPEGWFPPVLPGTKFLTVGGAVANDIHGKNHHRLGTFGHHVRSFELLRSGGRRVRCSKDENAGLFHATIGGLGLTGLLTWVEMELRPVRSSRLDAEFVTIRSLEDYFGELEESDRRFEHHAAWIDGFAPDRALGRGLLNRANHVEEPGPRERGGSRHRPCTVTVPFDMPAWFLNDAGVRLFNAVFVRHLLGRRRRLRLHYDGILCPEDRVGRWNRLYGRRGVLEYHCVVPRQGAREAVGEILERVRASGERFYLGVLKSFGDRPSLGLLSFCRPGISLAMDFPFRGDRTLELFEALDGILLRRGGVLYPAKDSRMSAAAFQSFYPRWREFLSFVDPRFSSGFWRRVAG